MRFKYIAPLLASTVMVTPAFAQDEATLGGGWTASTIVVTGERESYGAPVSATATRTATPVEEVPQSIQTITRSLIEDQDLQSLTEALVNVSGVVPTSQEQVVLQGTLIRGFVVDTYVDGVPTYMLPPGAGDPQTLVQVERIEVAKGPTATLYGGGSGAPLSGLINLVSRLPGEEASGNLRGRIGAFETWGISGGVNLPITDGVAFRIDGLAEQADSHIDFVTTEKLGLYPTLLLALGENTRLVVRGRYSNLEQTEYAGVPYELLDPVELIDPEIYAGSRDQPRTWVENKAITGELTHDFSSFVSATLIASRVGSEFQEWTSFPYGQIDGTLYNFGTGFLPSDTQKTYLSAAVSARLGDGSIRHTLLAGVDYDHTDYYGAMYFNPAWQVIDYADHLPAPSFGETPPFYFDQKDRLESVALFAQDQIALGDAIDVTLGLRWTRIAIRSDMGAFGATDKTNEKVTPRVGITAQVINGISLFAGYAEGFKGVVGAAFYGLTPEPETSQAWEGGIKLAQPVPGLSGTLSLYRITRQNVLVPIPDSFFYNQSGEQRAQGVELDLIYEPTANLSLLANYALTDAEVTADTAIPVGDTLRAVPRHSGRLAARYRFTDGQMDGFAFGLGLTAVSRRELTLPNTLSVPGNVLFDAQASKSFGTFSIGLSAVNLLGADAYEPYQYFGGTYVIPVQPQSVFVTLGLDF